MNRRCISVFRFTTSTICGCDNFWNWSSHLILVHATGINLSFNPIDKIFMLDDIVFWGLHEQLPTSNAKIQPQTFWRVKLLFLQVHSLIFTTRTNPKHTLETLICDSGLLWSITSIRVIDHYSQWSITA